MLSLLSYMFDLSQDGNHFPGSVGFSLISRQGIEGRDVLDSPKRMKSNATACEMPGFYFDILVDELPDSSVIPCRSHVAGLH